MLKLNRFAIFAWAVLAYNLLVILWGAVVRATGSGAGVREPLAAVQWRSDSTRRSVGDAH
ncbi:MAG: hypothetical protein WKF84_19560 [Pyrinomonadaceae bacterium]